MIRKNHGGFKFDVTNKKQKKQLLYQKIKPTPTKTKKAEKVVETPKQKPMRPKKDITKMVLGGGGNILKKLDIIITCVNYSDFLILSLKENIKLGFPITVITSERDPLTIKLCKEFDVNYVITEDFFEDGAVFNKGKGINAGINQLKNPEWILHLDADIVLPEDFTTIISNKALSTKKLYSATRYMCYTFDKYQKFLDGKIKLHQMDAVHMCPPVGYFQLFHYTHPNLKDKEKIYPERSKDASWSDLLFADKFPEKECLKNIRTIHLGYDGQNWKGRKTERFITDVEFFNTLDSDIPRFIRHPEIPENIRDNKIEGNLAVITSYFNPKNYQNIKNNYKRFSEALKGFADLFTVELSYNDNFMLPDNKFNLRIKGNKKDHIMWQKEKLLNLLITKIPKEYTNIAWLDCDILFENPNWVTEINEKLKYYPVVQVYEVANRLNKNEEIERQSIGIAKYNSTIQNKETNFNNAIPGFGWAARRELLEKHKLFEYNILGGGDSMMCYAFYGTHKNNFLIDQMNNKWKKLYIDWANKICADVDKSVGYISGTITHQYHGSHENRKYNDRFSYLSNNDYDPITDIVEDKNGAWKWSTNKTKMIQLVQNYFGERKEDDTIIQYININDFFDQVYVLNLDREPDKYLKTKKQLDLFDIKHIRFSGVDGNSIEITNNWDNVKKNINFKPGSGLIENKFAYGCLLSHQKIIQHAKKHNYKKILILEDDVLIHQNFKNEIQKLKNLPTNWKMIYFGTSQYNWDNLKYLDFGFYLANKSLGTFAYAIDSSIFDDIITTSNCKQKSIDNYLGNDIQKKYYNDCYVFNPNIIIADVSKSYIRGERDQITHSKKMKWEFNKFIK